MQKANRTILFILLLASVFGVHAASLSDVSLHLPFNKIIIWGHKLHSHTHSYIHYAYDRAFRHLGYDTYWLDNNDDVSYFDFANSLFITEGQADRNIPLCDDCIYVVHNCDMVKYHNLMAHNRVVTMQVYTHDCLARDVEKIEDCVYFDYGQKVFYMPWATDLLPYEIDAIKARIATKRVKNSIARFIGSICYNGPFGNYHELMQFQRACATRQIGFDIAHAKSVTPQDNIDEVLQAYMAPAIQGEWQCEKGYIPCRIFKNISYGQPGITNSKTVYELLQKKVVYNADCYQLFFDAQQRLQTMTLEDLYEQMDLVKTKHTYLNRIQTMFQFLVKVGIV